MKRGYAIVAIMLLFLLGIAVFKMDVVREVRAYALLSGCGEVPEGQEQIDCINRVVEREIIDKSIADGMRLFPIAYNFSKSFAHNCHEQAHKAGDVIYYSLYRNNINDVSKIDFPPETIVCNQGLIHGFLEHLTQDNPDSAFILKECEAFRSRFNRMFNNADVIGNRCLSPAGHGFVYANAEHVPREKWGDIRAFADEPLKKCGQLAEREKQFWCAIGVFTTITNWMASQEYGLSFNNDDVVALCRALKLDSGWLEPCYSEMILRSSATDVNLPDSLQAIVSSTERSDVKRTLFSLLVTGNISRTITENGRSGYQETLGLCESFNDEFYALCLSNIIMGLLNHGIPQHEYKAALLVCNEPTVTQRNARDACYQNIIEQLPLYYAQEKRGLICGKFPKDVRERCKMYVADASERMGK